MALVVVHALAALWHHFIRRDGVLRAMLPGRLSPATPQRRRNHLPLGYERRHAHIPVAFERRRSMAIQ
jgi:hypothetical protein